MPGESKTSPRRIEAVEKSLKALALRKAGATFEDIAKVLGYKDRSGAYRAIAAALDRVPAPEVGPYRKLNLERLNAMRQANWKRALTGDTKAIATELAIQVRESALLGLDAPAQVNIQFMLREAAERIAKELDLDIEAVVAEAESLLGAGRRGGR